MKPSIVIPQFLAEADIQDQSRALYDFSIRKFFLWVHANNIDPDNINRADLIKYKKQLQNSGLSISTVKNYLTIVRIFFSWASQNGIHDDVMVGIKSPRYDNTYKRYPLTGDQVKQLLNSIDRSTEIGVRDYALILLMVFNGLRRLEVSAINVSDIVVDGEKQGIYIKGKGRLEKDQFIKITDSSVDAINDYLVLRKVFDDKDPLFTSTYSTTKGKRLEASSITRVIKKRMRAIDLDSKYYTCHSLRHTAACLLLSNGFDLHKVQLFMRHKSPATTQLYTRVIDEQIRLENEAGNTLEKLISINHKNTIETINK